MMPFLQKREEITKNETKRVKNLTVCPIAVFESTHYSERLSSTVGQSGVGRVVVLTK